MLSNAGMHQPVGCIGSTRLAPVWINSQDQATEQDTMIILGMPSKIQAAHVRKAGCTVHNTTIPLTPDLATPFGHTQLHARIHDDEQLCSRGV